MKSRALTELASKLSTRLVHQSFRHIRKVIVSKAKTKHSFEVAKDLLCQLGRAEQTVSLFIAQAISVFPRKTVSFEEQIMSKDIRPRAYVGKYVDKYLSIFLKSNGGYCAYYPSNIFRNTGAGSASLPYVKHVKDCQLASKIHTSRNIQISFQSKACV